MTDATSAPTKKDVLAAFNAIEATTVPPTTAEVKRARLTRIAEEAIEEVKGLLVDTGIADGDLVKAQRVASSLSGLLKNATAAIASIPDNILDPDAEPAAPKPARKPRETKTATLSTADVDAAIERERAKVADASAAAAASPVVDEPESPEALVEQSYALIGETQEALAKVAPQRPPLTRPIPAEAPNTDADPRGATDPNADDEGF